MDIESFPTLLKNALQRRESLFETLHSERTNAYRLFHGIAEGASGLTIDRYGGLILAQTFRDPLSPSQVISVEAALRTMLPYPFAFAYNHRAKRATETFDQWHHPSEEALGEFQCQEWDTKFLIRARHPGIDPWLFLDLRAGRRKLRENVAGKTVLNLFSYTCSVGITAVDAGAKEVWNVDFASSSLETGRRNAALNGISETRFRTIEEDCLPVMRQLAGLSSLGRTSQKKRVQNFDAREFDFVFLDPPAWSKGAFGAIDVAGDYASLFKSAVLSTKPAGGCIIATNHVASVEVDSWVDVLKRCASKAGRPIQNLDIIKPEDDFPSFDGKPPLKIAVCKL